MYNSSHTSDLSSSMTSSSVTSAMMTESELASVHKSIDPLNLCDKLINSSSVSINSVLDTVSRRLIEQLFATGNFREVIEVTSDLLEDKESAFLFKARGECLAQVHCYDKAIEDLSQALKLDPLCYKTHNNLGLSYKEIGLLDASAFHIGEAIRINPLFAEAHNNFGNVKSERADVKGARRSYLKSIEIDPNNAAAFWNLHSTYSDIDHAKTILEYCLEKDHQYEPAIYTLATINAVKGNHDFLDWMLSTEIASDSTLRSIAWMLSLPKLPKLEFNRWDVFDVAVAASRRDRAFYEYGVWMGESFRYLAKKYQKSFGFDTFEGLPEDWHNVPSGTYSSFGKVPKVSGAQFIVGEFSQSLPKFFSKNRPAAGLLNFDADLYSSTLCALRNSRSVIDQHSILVFDELIVNQNWEEDEYRALEEFCGEFDWSYDVICVSLFTKQVVLKLK